MPLCRGIWTALVVKAPKRLIEEFGPPADMLWPEEIEAMHPLSEGLILAGRMQRQKRRLLE